MPFAAKEDPLFTRSRRWINNLPRHTSTIKWLTSHRPSNSSADDTKYLCSFVNRTNRCFTYLCVYIRMPTYVPWSPSGLLHSCRGYGKPMQGERLVNDTYECNIRWTTIWTHTPELFLILLREYFYLNFWEFVLWLICEDVINKQKRLKINLI